MEGIRKAASTDGYSDRATFPPTALIMGHIELRIPLAVLALAFPQEPDVTTAIEYLYWASSVRHNHQKAPRPWWLPWSVVTSSSPAMGAPSSSPITTRYILGVAVCSGFIRARLGPWPWPRSDSEENELRYESDVAVGVVQLAVQIPTSLSSNQRCVRLIGSGD